MIPLFYTLNGLVNSIVTSLSIPISNNMKKKRIDHSWGRGINVAAFGYTINTNPGPNIEMRNHITIYEVL